MNTSATRRPVLLTVGRQTSTGVVLAEAAVRRGLEHTAPAAVSVDAAAALGGREVYWYGGPLAANRCAGALGLGLLEPSDAWQTELPREFTGRRIELTTLADAWTATRPRFVKPPGDKQFPAAVYADGGRLPRSGERIGPDTAVLVSDPVTFAWEYRLFVLDGRIAAGSRYARFGHLDTAPLAGAVHEAEVRTFAAALLDACAHTLPSAVVVDVGLIQDPDSGAEQWAVVEANMAWFAHSYAADPDAVLDVVLRAAGPLRDVAPADRRFLSPLPATAPGRTARPAPPAGR
ncbi:ATP-grasp domain-containing protein [Streptacidiphilus sp. ASG 303]|uniref:ATP-grasp domain-containing protein n=1 Tax=Streptacidiphilus sp. ASG 303 TaxID=2896847 RepID=UPI001E653B7E|nr:ATP-grasp domain-containing protein [Streptacidiphilus sp. ASG 303]MCD0484575.1 ATP-grasp domain-containing protein [Streptacidiphilus sp. ASG 303]